MSIYSFNNMARAIDEMKIERIKNATIEMVVANGYGGASISKIAKNAKVAEGYLYRFYASKNDLVNDLLFTSVNELADELEAILDDKHSVWEIFRQLHHSLFKLAHTNPDKMKFIFVLIHDYNFELINSQRRRIFDLCKRVKDIGISKMEFRSDITEEEIYLMGVSYPIQFINLRFKGFFDKSELNAEVMEQALKICINSLRSNTYENGKN